MEKKSCSAVLYAKMKLHNQKSRSDKPVQPFGAIAFAAKRGVSETAVAN